MSIQSLKVFLINLERAQSRRVQMRERLERKQIEYEYYPAVDGKQRQHELKDSVDIKQFERNVGRPIMWGEIGCYHSHINVWKKFLYENSEEVLLVLEDDVVFGEDFKEALELSLLAKDHWDFLKLNKIRANQPITQGRIGQYYLNAYLGTATGLGAYLIKRDTIKRLLPQMLPITRPIDHELDRIHVHQFKHFGLEPFPSYVDDGNVSTITGEHFSGVKKHPKYQRIPHYFNKLKTTLGKCVYLIRTGQVFKKTKSLI